MRVKQQVFRPHLLEQFVREILEKAPLRVLDIVNGFDLWPRLTVHLDAAERVQVLIG